MFFTYHYPKGFGSPAFRRLILRLQLAELRGWGFCQLKDMINAGLSGDPIDWLINRRAVWEDGVELRKFILKAYKDFLLAERELNVK